jgi:SAM-dependent methyltransferase
MLAMLTSMDSSPTEAVGLELAESSVDECRVRFASQVRLSFEAIDGYFVESNQVSFDTVMCTEVLEHVVHVDAVIDDLAFVLKPDGRLIVSVPVETGLPLVAKQIARRVLGWRGIGDYPGNTPYSITELLKSIVAGKDQHIVRPIHEYCGVGSHDHKGFNWRHLEKRLERRFVIEHRFGSPIAWLTPGMNSQVWFVCKRRDVS